MKKKAHGFTIIELLVVIIVIAILASISIVTYNGIQQRARDAQREQDIAQIIKALELYYMRNGRYPLSSGSTALNGYWSTSYEPTSWANVMTQLTPFVSSLPVDPKNDGVFGYEYYTNAAGAALYCGASGTQQMFILGYRLESGAQKQRTSGTCATSALTRPHSYYRAVR